MHLFSGRRNARTFSECTKENVTFSNDMEVSNVHIGIEHGGNCDVALNLITCGDPHYEADAHAIFLSDTDVLVEIDSIEMFYGHNVTVTMNDTCDSCRERFYIPDMKSTGQPFSYKTSNNYFDSPVEYMFITKGSIIDDLSNDYGCDFGGPVVDYKICIHTGESNNCYATPCGNGKIYTSLCSGSTTSNERVSLEVDEVENGTVVSIFCARTDCNGFHSNVMLFNIGICKFKTYKTLLLCLLLRYSVTCENCSENAKCLNGECMCKDNYVGDGKSCEEGKYSYHKSECH